jgi:hypothetical protein
MRWRGGGIPLIRRAREGGALAPRSLQSAIGRHSTHCHSRSEAPGLRVVCALRPQRQADR